MRSIADTIARLKPHLPGSVPGRLSEFTLPFDNPGNLSARVFLPEDLAPGAALVVVLHGCTQTADGYDHGAGWSEVAERNGFALLVPEQQRANNPNLCFNWFLTGDTTRGQGEVASIRAMIAAMVGRYAIDPARVFITGLSAGGAMTAAMLATYPEVFAGGAIVAGLPHGVAASVPQALERMRGQGLPGSASLGRLVQDASPHRGRWPAVSVWHGSADATVVPAAGEAVVAQWLAVDGLARGAFDEKAAGGHTHRVWHDRAGRAAVESHVIAGMGHGTPLDTDQCGASGPFMLDVGVSSTLRIAERWGLADPADRRSAPKAKPAHGVGRVIEDALRTAGLIR